MPDEETELEAQFSSPEDDGAGGEETTPPPPEPPASSEPTRYTIRGQEYGEDDLAALLEFQNWAQQNPDKMTAFAQYLRGDAQFVIPEPEVKPKEPEIDWDEVDPNIRTAYEMQQERLEALQSKIGEFEQPLMAVQQRQWEEAQREAQAALNEASGAIMGRFKLSNDEMDELADEAARLNIVPGLRQQGMPPRQALETALETAFWRNEKWRNKVVDEQISARTANNRRDKAARIGGTSAASGNGLGSEAPVPATEAERRTAMAAEIAESMRGTP